MDEKDIDDLVRDTLDAKMVLMSEASLMESEEGRKLLDGLREDFRSVGNSHISQSYPPILIKNLKDCDI